MSETLAKFYEYRGCPKCAAYHRRVQFHPVHRGVLYEATPECMGLDFGHMVATCERCGYAVIELPLDAQP